MPRAPKNSPNVIYDTLKELRFIDDAGVLLPYANEVWQKASDLFNGPNTAPMQKDYVYLYLKKNRNGVFGRLHGESIGASKTVDTTVAASANESQHDSNWSMGETACVLPPLRTEIVVSKNEWDKLKSHIVEYKERQYEVVFGWSDAIYDILWSDLKLPCPYAFKNAKINRNSGEVFLSIKGSCAECQAKIHIYCDSEPTEDGGTFYMSTFDSRGVAHDKKRQLRGDQRIRIGKQLQGKSTCTWRRDKAKKLMTSGDVVPANLPSEEVVRKAKQETRDKELGLFKVKSALASVWDMKNGLEFNECIHEIGLDKFYVMYWTPTQLFLYKKFLQEDDFASISIDATGSLVKQLPKPDGSKQVVYLYQAVCGYRRKVLPLFQLVSEKNDTNTLEYWIREWLRSGGSCPKQVVTDYSLALLNATSLAFNNSDLKTYIENCLVAVPNSSVRVNPPRCLIRIDIAHLIKLVTRWSCFNNESPEKKDFYVRCVGLLTTCTRIDDFIRLCTDVLTVALASHEDINDKDSHCFAAQSRVMERLKSYNLPKDDPNAKNQSEPNSDDNLLEYFDDFDRETTLESSSVIDSILEKIDADSKSDLNHGRLNPYRCSNFGSRLLKLAKQFVLWTAIMIGDDLHNSTLEELEDEKKVRLVSSSARSEEYFRELKHLVFKKEKSIRIDKYLVIHLNSLKGTTNLLNAPDKTVRTVKRKIVHSTSQAAVKDVNKSGDLVCIHEHFREHDREYEADAITNTANPPIDMDDSSEKFCPNDAAITNSDCKDPYDHGLQSITDSVHDGGVCNSTNSVTDFSNRVSMPNEVLMEPEHAESEQAFLNEAEDWGGLTKKTEPVKGRGPDRPERRGKFLTPCPDIEIIQKRPEFSRRIPLLVNGNSLRPAEIEKKTIAVRNTCAFDSVVQSMLAAYQDYASYHKYVTESNIAIHKFVDKFSRLGACLTVYDERGLMLSTTKKVTNGVLDCSINVATLIEKFVLRDAPSVEICVQCSNCEFRKSRNISVLDIDPTPIFRNGMRGLQEAVTKCTVSLASKNRMECTRCRSTNVITTVSGGNHLIINTETVEIDMLAENRGLSNCRKQFTLLELPDRLHCGNHAYKLVSAVVYLDSHYWPFIKRASGKWEEHNDLTSTKRVIDIRTRTLLQQHSIHLLFYVKSLSR